MPFKRQTLQETVAEVEAGLASRLPGADTRLRRAVLSVLARVVAGVVYGLDAFIAFLSKQFLPDTAERGWLERIGRIWRVLRKQAEAATGTVTLTGTPGAVILSGTLLQRADGGQYESTEEVPVAEGTAHIPVRAVLAGSAGNGAAGTTLSLVQPVEGFAFSGAVGTDGITGGFDVEGDDAYRARIITRWQEPPQGGSDTDWKAWTLEVPGATRAWVKPRWMGLGTVGIFFVTDDAQSPIPDATMIQRVYDHLTDPDIKPITADVYVLAPTPKPVDIVIEGLTPATEAVKAAIQAELQDLFRREGEPGRVVLISHIRESISTAAGEHDHVLLAPAGNVYPAAHELPMLGTVTFEDAS